MTHPPFSPVPVAHRSDGWTPERQWRFVEALSVSASVSKAARAVGMTPRSAQRLRRHPEAAAFRAAWDAALAQIWGQLEQVALDRAMNGEVETIERNNLFVAERTRPCSDRLLIFLLQSRERARAAARAERAEAHQRAMAAARIEAIIAAKAAPRGKRGATASAPPPEAIDDAGAETAALAAFHARAAAFAAWPAMDDDCNIYPAPAPEPYAPPTPEEEAEMAARREAAIEDMQAAEYEARPRWEDYRIPGTDRWADTPDASRRP